jgi:SAM-dependent methyltransferase
MDCICGNRTFSKFISSSISSVYSRDDGKTYRLLECGNCKVLQTFPFPTEADLSEIYLNKYAYDYHNAVSGEKSYRAKSLIKLLLKYTSTTEILEFGSGSGILLKEASKLGLGVIGVEISQKAGNVMPNDLNNRLLADSAENFLSGVTNLPSTVVMSHTLEHFLRPYDILLKIYEKLDFGGAILIVVPNNKNFINRYRSRFWGYWQVPVHTYHFNYKSLRDLLIRTGFAPVKVAYRSGDFLSKGLFLTNLLGLSGGNLPKRRLLSLIKLMSNLWFLFYKFGRSDLIVIAKK